MKTPPLRNNRALILLVVSLYRQPVAPPKFKSDTLWRGLDPGARDDAKTCLLKSEKLETTVCRMVTLSKKSTRVPQSSQKALNEIPRNWVGVDSSDCRKNSFVLTIFYFATPEFLPSSERVIDD